MTAVAKARDWLAELRAARDERDKDKFIDLLTAIALAAPELQGAAGEIARGFGDDEDQWEEWARGFFISSGIVPKADDAAKLDAAITAKAKLGAEPIRRRKVPPDPSATRKVEARATPFFLSSDTTQD